MRIAVTILPAGAAGDAVVDLAAFVAVGLAVEDLMSDFFETGMGITSSEICDSLYGTTYCILHAKPNLNLYCPASI